MPAFITAIAVNLNELLENGRVAARTLGRESCRIVEVTIDVAIVLVIRVLWPKERRAHRTGEVVHMELLV